MFNESAIYKTGAAFWSFSRVYYVPIKTKTTKNAHLESITMDVSGVQLVRYT